MRCPFCGENDDKVIDSRESRSASVVRRRRECLKCTRRFTTYERQEDVPVMVVKKDGRREILDRRKLLAGLLKACEKRSVPLPELEEIVEEIMTQATDAIDREIPSHEIGAKVMQRLQKLDKVAYVRFASVYREFEDVHEFLEELKKLIGPGARSKRERP